MYVSDGVYRLNATIAGLRYRRIVNRAMFLSTSRSNTLRYIFLASATLSFQVFGTEQDYDYRETLSPWLRQLLMVGDVRRAASMTRVRRRAR